MKLCLIAVVLMLAGCSTLEKACAAAMPVLTLGQSHGGDAAQAVEQAESYANNNLPPATREKLGAALEVARKALRIGQVALASAATTCTKLDPLTAFNEFIVAWKQVREILASNGTLIGVAPGAVGGLPFDDPAIYRLANGGK